MEKCRNPKTKVYTDRTVKSLGYLYKLEKLYEDPITHFREVAERMTEEQKAGDKLEITIDMNERLCADTDNVKSFGYAAILKVYHELDLDTFLRISTGIRILSIILIPL